MPPRFRRAIPTARRNRSLPPAGIIGPVAEEPCGLGCASGFARRRRRWIRGTRPARRLDAAVFELVDPALRFVERLLLTTIVWRHEVRRGGLGATRERM
jgi:hypothetical protein